MDSKRGNLTCSQAVLLTNIIWRLEDMFFVKKKRYVNPGMTKAEKYIMDDNRPQHICSKIYSTSVYQGKCAC